ncbi:hypothetical protein Q3G72_019500 [Acer saccharum]|nr:hypothetical protein Q3G72_019500 [Acer saccharum]
MLTRARLWPMHYASQLQPPEGPIRRLRLSRQCYAALHDASAGAPGAWFKPGIVRVLRAAATLRADTGASAHQNASKRFDTISGITQTSVLTAAYNTNFQEPITGCAFRKTNFT